MRDADVTVRVGEAEAISGSRLGLGQGERAEHQRDAVPEPSREPCALGHTIWIRYRLRSAQPAPLS